MTAAQDVTARIDAVLGPLRTAAEQPQQRDESWRRRQLEGVAAMLRERRGELAAALASDLGKPPTESQLTELGLCEAEVAEQLGALPRRMRPRRVGVPFAVQPALARVVPQPLGVVLVIAPWNYPVQLSLVPLIGALAAGNTVLLKPSELAPATSAALARWLPEHLDPSAVGVVEGDAAVTTELLRRRFDHLFYTGGARVGRIVMAAAAEHLTPVTLELGGKSPAFVDEGVDLERVAHRLAWGKFMNAGQTCVAPDHVLTTAAVAPALVAALRSAITELYGADPATSSSYGRIVDQAHHDRLTGLLADSPCEIGGQHDRATRYLAPTVLRCDADHPLMAEEIFGPILPVVTVAGVDEAIRTVNAGPRPLAAYVFSPEEAVRRRFETETVSGALVFGATSMHLSTGLPFGGVGESGIGRYHGEFSFQTFSHLRAVLDKPLHPDTARLVYPPFSAIKRFLAGRLVGGRR